MKLTKNDRKVLKQIIEQGSCSGLNCVFDECPLIDYDCGHLGGNAYMFAKVMLAEDVSIVCEVENDVD